MKDIFIFIFGVAIGAILALLFAPQSGQELRANIQATAEQDWQKAQAQWQADQGKLHDRLDSIQQALQKQPAESETTESETTEAA
jgi:gas vesicle protein